MNLILVVGHTGQGKSTWVKSFVKGKKTLVFDVNNEYQNFKRDTNLNHVDFVKNCLESVTGTNIIFEDATGFFEGRISKEASRLIIQKRHAKNNLIFLFHSITDIPPRIARIANFLVLFGTLDEAKHIEGKYRNLYRNFLDYHNTKVFSHNYNGSKIYKPKIYKLI